MRNTSLLLSNDREFPQELEGSGPDIRHGSVTGSPVQDTIGRTTEAVVRGIQQRAKVFLTIVAAIGWVALLYALASWASTGQSRYLLYLGVFVIASCLKVWLPGITGHMSVNYVFVFLAVLELSLPETLVMASVGAVVQTLWLPRQRPTFSQLAFSIGTMAVAVTCTYRLYHHPVLANLLVDSIGLRLAAVACAYYFLTTFPVASMIALNEGKSPVTVWRNSYVWCFSYYLLGAALAGALSILNRSAGYQTTLLALPALFLVYRSYRLYLDRLERETVHANEMANIHLRTIEALATAIEAKDEETHAHLERVQIYATELARAAGLTDDTVQAVRAAAILHDIGKLAVPEHILSKPGRLSKEEFEKIKIHPVVGAEIIERVQFPYPVAPIVRHHHERWNGEGYPDGLRGDEIPVGARILSIVDSLDALASDRPYHRALSIEDAVQEIALQAGEAFDPRFVSILQQHYKEWEALAKSAPVRPSLALPRVQVAKGTAPAAGLECGADPLGDSRAATRRDLRQEVLKLEEISLRFRDYASFHDAIAHLEVSLSRVVRYDTIVIYFQNDGQVAPCHVRGAEDRFFRQLRIPVGEGLAGWVFQIGKPIVNGNPAVEAGYLEDPARFTTLRSTLAVPLQDRLGPVGVLALYSKAGEAFSQHDLNCLLAVAPQVCGVLSEAVAAQHATSAEDLARLLQEASRDRGAEAAASRAPSAELTGL